MKARILVVALATSIVATLPLGSRAAYDTCAPTRPASWRAASGVADPAGDVRVFAIQFKQEIRHAVSYDSFRQKMRCLVQDLVLPDADANGDGKADRPTIVVFNEDIGLATIATGSRGAGARAIAAHGPKDPATIAGAQAAFAALAAPYAPSIAWYREREPETSPQRLILAAATDTFARGFMRTFSDLAREYGIYVVASNNQAEFRETADPAAIAALADPDLAPTYASGALSTVFEAVDVDVVDESIGSGRAGIDVYNQAWLWAPVDGVTDYAAARWAGLGAAEDGALAATDPRANIIAVNKKTPLTSIELQTLDLSDDRDIRPENTGPFTLLPADDPDGDIRIGFGISLPSFKWGTPLHEPLPDGTDPCASPETWMRCLDARGVTLFLQPEANPGRWGDYIDRSWTPDAFQALSWLDSAWRAVADDSVHSIRYAVTPHLVGNLVDLTFDGQSAIFERCIPRDGGDTCEGNTAAAFVGAGAFVPCPAPGATRCDDPALEPYAAPKREAIVLAPWVLGDADGDPAANRERLAARSRAMEAGTGAPEENDYLETAVWADLDFD